jgi:hypothetical protein
MMGRAYLITLANDEIRMTNDEEMSNDEFRNSILNLARLFVIRLARDSQPTMRISSLIGRSSLVLRHWGDDGPWLHCAELFSAAGKSCKSRDGSA